MVRYFVTDSHLISRTESGMLIACVGTSTSSVCLISKLMYHVYLLTYADCLALAASSQGYYV